MASKISSGSFSENSLGADNKVRIEDYLNDKLQTRADLDSLDSLLEDVKKQQYLLRKQLEEAEADLATEQLQVQDHTSSVLKQAEAFRQYQNEIDADYIRLTGSTVSDEAVERLQGPMDKIQQIDIAVGYVQILKDVDRLSQEARKLIKDSPQAALKPYSQLQFFCNDLQSLSNAAEGAAPHLLNHVEKTTKVLWNEMKSVLVAEFEAVLKKIKWPGKDVQLGSFEDLWRQSIFKLLEFQRPEFAETEGMRNSVAKLITLLPLEVMLKPLELRFRYHFDGDRPTNRADKPEYFLSHMIGLLNTYDPFFRLNLQPILDEAFGGSGIARKPQYTNSTLAFVTALLPMLRRKIFSYIPQISHQPQLLSHFIHELISFDDTLREEWGYANEIGPAAAKGLTWEVLVKHDWFNRWLLVEKEFALARYQSIIDSKDGGEIDYDSVDAGITKPTKSAIRVNDLLETITDRYRPLASFSQKLRFLIDIQIAIFDKFHHRLQSSLEAYLAASSTVVRAVQGVSKEEKASVEGVSGLKRLCRVYGSAEYLEKAMSDWSDDVFFLELWDELQERARRNTGQNLAGTMSMEDIAERTSTSVGVEDENGALFDETTAAYRTLRIRTEELIIEILVGNLREALRPYSRINPWSSLDAEESNFTITAELDAPLQILDEYLAYLTKVLAQISLRRICRQLALSIQSYLWDYLLLRNSFSETGANQFARDVTAMWRVMDKYLGEGQGVAGMAKLGDTLTLLVLQNNASSSLVEEPVDLQSVASAAFENNEKARSVLERIGVTLLSEAEARSVLERRVELAS